METTLLRLLASSFLSSHGALVCLNALCILVLQRADVELMSKVLALLDTHPLRLTLVPVFCSSLLPLLRFGLGISVLQVPSPSCLTLFLDFHSFGEHTQR